jgi:hypothetical protein
MAAVLRHWERRWVRVREIQAGFTPEQREAAENSWMNYEDDHDEILNGLAAKSSPALVDQIIRLLRTDADHHHSQQALTSGVEVDDLWVGSWLDDDDAYNAALRRLNEIKAKWARRVAEES